MSREISAFMHSAKETYEGFSRGGGLSREGARVTLEHFEIPEGSLKRTFICPDDFNATIKCFLDIAGTLLESNGVIKAAYNKCSQSEKEFLAHTCDDGIFSWLGAERMIADRLYYPICIRSRDDIAAVLKFAGHVIQALRDEVGTDNDRRYVAKLLIHTQFSPHPPFFKINYQPTDLYKIAGLNPGGAFAAQTPPSSLPNPPSVA